MLSFLKLVGAVVVALALLAVAGYFYVRHKFKGLFNALKEGLAAAGGGVPPFRIKLEPRDEASEDDDDDFFMNESEVQQHSVTLESLGFHVIGDFESDAMFSLRAFGFQQATIAVVYDHFTAGVWCDIFRGFTDGTSITYATTRHPGMDSMPGKRERFFPDLDLAEVVQQFWNDVPVNDIEVVPDEEFPRYFEKKYAEAMNWNIQRGGPSEQEILRIAEMGGDECTPEMIKAIQDQWAVAISEFLCEMAVKQFNKDHNIPKREAAEREYRVVAIHERMPTNQILAAVYEDYYFDESDTDDDDPEMARWRNEFQTVETQRTSQNATKAFHAVLEKSGQREKFELLGTVSKPVEAEIWLRPDDEDDEFGDDDDFDEYEDDEFQL